MKKREPIERLLRLSALRDTGTVEERLDRVRQATRPHWQHAVERHSRRRSPLTIRLLPIAAAVVLASVALALLPGSPLDLLSARRAPVARIVHSGSVSDPGEAERLLRAGTTLDSGGDTVALELLGDGVAGASLRLDRFTRVRLDRNGSINLEEGAAYVDNQGRAQKPIRIATSRLDVVDIGTQFEVRVGPAGESIRVREGRVLATLRSDSMSTAPTRWRIGPGARLLLPAGSHQAQIEATARSGQDWSWVIELARAPRFDGRPLLDLLTWSTRELGIELHYTDAATENVVRADVVHGNVTGLAPQEALEVGLAVTGLERRIEGEHLVLSTSGLEGAER